MKLETAAKLKYGGWGLICGAVIAMIIGFVWGGWTTFGTSQTRTKEAVLASQAAICVAQFMKQPNPEEKLKALAGRPRRPMHSSLSPASWPWRRYWSSACGDGIAVS
jgi:hypothetical protein